MARALFQRRECMFLTPPDANVAPTHARPTVTVRQDAGTGFQPEYFLYGNGQCIMAYVDVASAVAAPSSMKTYPGFASCAEDKCTDWKGEVQVRE